MCALVEQTNIFIWIPAWHWDNSPFVLAFCGSRDNRTKSFKDELFNLPLNQIAIYLPNPSKSLVESIINSSFVQATCK